MVMERRSMASVVVVLAGSGESSSTPAATEVIIASVVMGGTSEMLATAVVFPTPTPPAMTILTGSGGLRSERCRVDGSRDGTETMDHPSEGIHVYCGVEVGEVDGKTALGAEVADQDLHHAEVEREPGADL